MTIKKKDPRNKTPEDAKIGQRIRVRRIEAAMSQAVLGEKLGVTFQQVQKYEKGVNRVSATRLQQIAKLFEEPSSYFTGEGETASTTKFTSLLTDAPSQRLLKAFSNIPSTEMRYKIVHLIEQISGGRA